jgi:hypothetical protein
MVPESERLLDLMFGAKDRYRTARATIREWRDERTADEVFPEGTFVLDLPGVEFGRVDWL